jgi:methionine-rich copper-binding protein CopC
MLQRGTLLPFALFGSIARVKRTLLIVIVALLVSAGAAHAHARLIRSQPAQDARLTTAPATIELWFNELLDRSFNGVDVFAATESPQVKRTSLISAEAVVDPNDRTHLSAPLPPLPPGDYIVEYRVLSRDGHSAPGRIKFSVSAP